MLIHISFIWNVYTYSQYSHRKQNDNKTMQRLRNKAISRGAEKVYKKIHVIIKDWLYIFPLISSVKLFLHLLKWCFISLLHFQF